MPVSWICLQRLQDFKWSRTKEKGKEGFMMETGKRRQIAVYVKEMLSKGWERVTGRALQKENGIDGILVTVGLCIIALLLCVIMKDSLKVFIETIVSSLTTEAQNILTGV